MSAADDTPRHGYALLDAGGGRRLERFGDIVVDRPAPALAGTPRLASAAWDEAHARFDRPPTARRASPGSEPAGGWSRRPGTPSLWTASFAAYVLELRLAAGGQVGLFPEHLEGAEWLTEHVAQMDAGRERGRLPILNLFAYTGLATLVLARHGFAVTHVDASRPAIVWARRNADLNGLADAPVRWIVDDAQGFVRRELRRGRTYGAVLLDPPTYGHGPRGRGPRGEPWEFEERIGGLIAECRSLLVSGGALLLTTHTPDVSGERLASLLLASGVNEGVEHGPLQLRAESGAVLPLGAWARGTIG